MPTQNKLTPIVSLTGISTVGILTVGVTELAGGSGVSTTVYLRSILMHNTAGVGTCTSSVYVYPHWEEVQGVGKTAYELLRKDLDPGETYLWDLPSYPLIMTDREKLVVEIKKPETAGGSGIGSIVNYVAFGDESSAWA